MSTQSRPVYLDGLKEKGYAVIPHILTEQECQNWISEFWIAMQRFIPGATEETVCQPDSPWIHHLGGLIQSGFNHAPFMWWLRCHPGVLEIAYQIYGTHDLSVSFDGIAVERAPERRRNIKGREMTCASYDSKIAIKRNYHNDRNSRYRDPDRVHIQMEVPMNDVDPEDATLMVLENSHRYYEKFVKHFPYTLTGKKDWRPLTLEEKEWFLSKPDVREVAVSAPKGSVVLWDTKTVHSNKRATRGRPSPKFRYVAFVAYNIMSLLSQADLEKRRMMFERGKGSDTWGIQAFSDKPGARYPVTVRTMDDSTPCPKLFCVEPISLKQWGGEATPQIQALVARDSSRIPSGYFLTILSSSQKKSRLEALQDSMSPESYARYVEDLKYETPSMKAYMIGEYNEEEKYEDDYYSDDENIKEVVFHSCNKRFRYDEEDDENEVKKERKMEGK